MGRNANIDASPEGLLASLPVTGSPSGAADHDSAHAIRSDIEPRGVAMNIN